MKKIKIDRLIGIITILLQQDKITAPELAKRFEVSRRTINRDIEDICKAGIPVITTQGYGGGISISSNYKIDKSIFTNEELQAIIDGLKGIDSVSKTSYLTKLIERLKSNHIIVENIIAIDLASHLQIPLTQKIETIKEAILKRHLISFNYYYKNGECQRTIEPYRLIFKWSAWYVWGYCLDKKSFRLFKLNRLWKIQNSSETFELRDLLLQELDFKDYFIKGNLHLKALFNESEKYRLIEEYGIECYTTEQNKKLLFEQKFTSYENMRQWILSFGDRVEVLEPQNLRDDLKQQMKNILKKYNVHDI